MEQSRLRVGGWVEGQPDRSRAPASDPTSVPDLPPLDPDADPTAPIELYGWDRVLDDGVAEDDTYRGRRRHREPRVAGVRRLALVAVGVGALLLGIGAVQQWGSRQLDATPAPPPVPEHTRAAPTEGTSNLGLAPTGGATTPPVTDAPGGGTSPPSDDPAPPPPPVADFEAEAADRAGNAMVRPLDGASGGQVVRLVGVGSYVEFDVRVNQPGRYQLTILYAADDDRGVSVAVNQDVIDVTLTASGGAVATTSVRVDLTGGTNTVRIGPAGGGPPVSIDGLVLN